MKILNLSILSRKDKTRKKATIVFEKANGFPNVKMVTKSSSGKLIAAIKTRE